MRELLFEVLLRLLKALAAAILGLLVLAAWRSDRSARRAPSSCALLCWLSGAAFILLVQESPI